jgi:hypothetical protein
MLEQAQDIGEFACERGEELATSSRSHICGAWAADKDDRRGKGVATDITGSCDALCTNRPGTSNGETRLEQSL